MQQIITEFEKFMGENGQYYHEFYVGIAANLQDRLVNGHKVNNTVPHIYSTDALSTDVVRAIEKFFLSKGVKGGPGVAETTIRSMYTRIK